MKKRTVPFFLFFHIVVYGVIFPLNSFGAPANPRLFDLKQPSGFTFKARQHGDEKYNWIETENGFGIYRNKATDNWEYYLPPSYKKSEAKTVFPQTIPNAVVGEIDPASAGIPKGLRPPGKKQSTGSKQGAFIKKKLERVLSEKIKTLQASGTMHLLVIGVGFADSNASYMAEEIAPLLFGSTDSVSDYFSKASYQSVTILPATESQGILNDGFIGWLRLNGNHPNTGPSGWNSNANAQIAKDAILAADSYIDFSLYDTDGDGIIEPTELSILVIVAGYEASYDYGASSPSVWTHFNYMSDVGYPVADGKTIEEYAEAGEKHGDHLATIGPMTHEIGHLMFSLPDLYDTDTDNGDSDGVGYFDLMGYGSWGAESGAYDGSSPTYLSAWSREHLSWGYVGLIFSNQSVSFPKVDGNKSSIFRINTQEQNQYFLIENREFTGYDKGFQLQTGKSGHGGLVIYHIDKTKTDLWPSSNKVNADANDKGVDVEEANEVAFGGSMLDTDTNKSNMADTKMFFFAENNTSFTDLTTPGSKLKKGSPTNISITDISGYADTMTAKVRLTPSCEAATISLSQNKLFIKRKKSSSITLTLTGTDSCPSDGLTVTANVMVPGKKLISVLPAAADTDMNGEVTFTITAKNRTGRVKIKFKAGGLKKILTVVIR